MAARKSYGQFCGVARALDRIGDRWTLLIVRELLLGPKTFRELAAGLPGISPSLLTDRLATLVGDGLARRSGAPARSKAVEYSLSDEGRELEPVLFELIRWSGRWMLRGPGTDHVDPAWAKLALRALLENQPAAVKGVVHLDVAGHEVTIRSRGRHREVVPGLHGHPDATVAADLALALAIAAGTLSLAASKARIAGSKGTAAALLQPARRAS